MKFLLSIILLFIFNGLYKADDVYEPDEGVLDLNRNNFDAAVAENKYLLVEFYAPWCKYCKAMRPEYIKAAKLLMNEQSEIRLAKVDITLEKALKNRFNVRGIPNFKFFINGKMIEYKGAQNAEALVTWLKADHGDEL